LRPEANRFQIKEKTPGNYVIVACRTPADRKNQRTRFSAILALEREIVKLTEGDTDDERNQV
jgi:hypothetical protein